MNEWQEAQKWEADWWGNCVNTYGEETKQMTYASRMGLTEFMFHDGKSPYNFDLKGRSVIDIGGGPCSLLLKCVNVEGVVYDPLEVPVWILHRYMAAHISLIQCPGEALTSLLSVDDLLDAPESDYPYLEDVIDKVGRVDEAWLYNTLQHTQDPERVVQNARRCAKLIRVFEWIGTVENIGHPHILTEELLNEWFAGEGKVETLKGENTCNGTAYYGIFRGGA